jgi:hypothetical protein
VLGTLRFGAIGSHVCGYNGNKWEGSDVVPVVGAAYCNRNCNLVVSYASKAMSYVSEYSQSQEYLSFRSSIPLRRIVVDADSSKVRRE